MDLEFIDADAREKYTSRRMTDLARCRECLKVNDFLTIETIGHNLKGNGVSFGYPELSLLGEQMEHSAKESNAGELKALVDRLEEWISAQSKYSHSERISEH